VSDEQIGHILDLLQVEQQLQDAVGHQRVKRAGHLVTDDHPGLGRQRAGDADTLFLTA